MFSQSKEREGWERRRGGISHSPSSILGNEKIRLEVSGDGLTNG
jgi:hypothetical protein